MESVIKWKTGIPTKSGWYIVSTKGGKITYDVFTELHRWFMEDDVIAWCPLRDIEPYKE